MEINEAILKILKNYRGADNPISRDEMCRKLEYWMGHSVTDRKMREAVEDLRTNDPQGAFICHAGGGGDAGYFMANTRDELKNYLAVEHKRGVTILNRVNRQAKRAGIILDGQIGMGL